MTERPGRATGRAALVLAAFVAAFPVRSEPRHAIAMTGEPALPAGFDHVASANPAAPKGGRAALARIGSFDSLNPFLIKGVPAAGLGAVFESLLTRGPDEPFTLYGLLAEAIETPDDRSWVAFRLRPEARFQDGSAVSIDDVIFSYETLRRHGRPNHRTYYAKVAAVERPAPNTVLFRFAHDASGDFDREMPLIMGLMPILPQARYGEGRFLEASLELPLGSGPYRVARVEPGRSVTYARDAGYWGADLPINRGQFNLDELLYDYYRDRAVAFEAFKAGLIDIWPEFEPARWATGYDVPAVAGGRIRRAELPHGRPSGLHAFVFNQRRPPLGDRRVREALALAFDAEWVSRTLYHGLLARTRSLFDNSPLAGTGRAGPAERAILEAARVELPRSVLAEGWRAPGEGVDRRVALARAFRLLGEAGWVVRNGRMASSESGRPLAIEILIGRPEEERVALAWARDLERLGATARVRTVDAAQYQARLARFDFDVTIHNWAVSLSPGNEQAFYWGSAAADEPGSRNYAGIRDAGLDRLIALLLRQESRDGLVTAARALDRTLMADQPVVPLFHATVDRVAWWDRFGRPDRVPLHGWSLDMWWAEQAR